MRIYISGPISGRPLQEAFKEFEEMEKRISACGHTGVNPFKKAAVPNDRWAFHMRADIIKMMGCQAILLLPRWWVSRGAWIERLLALAVGIKRVRFTDLSKNVHSNDIHINSITIKK